MDGMQKTIYEAIQEILSKIEAGVYGEDDDIEAKCLSDDLENALWDIRD